MSSQQHGDEHEKKLDVDNVDGDECEAPSKSTCVELEESEELGPVDNINAEECNDVLENQNEKEKDEKDDLYFYTKSGDFTSEIFKICVENVPKFVGYQQLKKTFEKMNVEARKVKLDFNSRCAYLTFRSEEEREEAIKTITGYSLKNHILTAKKAKPKPDPLLKRRQMQNQDCPNPKKSKQDSEKIEDHLPPEKRVVRVVTNLYDMPYDEQLKLKEEIVKGILKRLTKDLLSANAGKWVKENSRNDDRICCPVDEIIPSPVLNHYRNKVEYNIGPGVANEGATVGFRLGTYKDDNFAVVSPSECINVSKEAKYIAKLFQDYIRKSDRDCYDAGKHTGCWRQLTVRSCCSGDVMVIVQIHPQTMSDAEIESLKSSLKDLFFSESNNTPVTSLYLQKCGQKQSGENISETYEHIYGSKTIQEHMMDMKFRISPDAFFQVNTPAAEALYSKVKEWCKITEDTIVLDVCCGTGTIGLAIAKNGVKRVIGIELCQQAVDDAKHNAEINGINNVEFICGKAEDFLYNVTKRLDCSDAVAVVDPPRAGLHKRVVLALRQCPAIKRLVYVSCNPKQAANNFLDLCRPRTNRNKGEPFRLLRVVPVDLFPHTKHCELILLMERIDDQSEDDTDLNQNNEEKQLTNLELESKSELGDIEDKDNKNFADDNFCNSDAND